jgi:hypothetical protein
VKNDTENYLNQIKSQPVGDFRIQQIVSRLSRKGVSENEDKKHPGVSIPFDRLKVKHIELID